MNKIAIAAELLKERAKKTTDATAFVVTVGKAGRKIARIILTEDFDRRDHHCGTFYHMDYVAEVCKALGLSNWVSGKVYVDAYGNHRATFEVHIY